MRLLLALALAMPTAYAQDFGTDVHTRAAPDAPARAAANQALAAGDYARALALLQPLAAAAPHDAGLRYDVGVCQDALDRPAEAEASYRAATAEDGALLAPRVALGLLLARAGKLAEARTELAAAVAQGAESGVSSSSSATGPAHTQDPADDALRARAFRALARLDQATRPADARDELLAALKLSPETPEDTLLSAELASKATGGAAAAEQAYRRVLAAQPGDAAASSALAKLLVAAQRNADARTVLEAGLAANPGDPAMTAQYASLLAAAGKPADAIPLVEHVVAAHPDDTYSSRLLAHLYVDAGDDAKAEPLLARLLAASPRDTGLADDRARVLIHLKRFAEAEALLAPLVADATLFPTPAALGDAAGDLAFAASANNDAAGALHALAIRATVLAPSPATLFLAAVSEDRLHHVKQARDRYRQFLAAAGGTLPDQEFEARHRLVALEHMK